MIGSGEPHEYDWLWGAALVSMIDIEPDCGGPKPRAFRVGAKNVGQCQDRVLVPRTWPVPTIVGARMIGAFRPLQIISSYSHCHKERDGLGE